MCLKLAQDQLKEILGREFFDDIEADYAANPLSLANLSADNQALYNPYLKDYLAWQTYFYYLGFSQSSSTATGERKFIDDTSEGLSGVEIWAKEKNVLQFVNIYRDKITNFLREAIDNSSTKYPLWIDQCKEQYSFGITSVDKKSDALIRVNKSLTTNE